MDKIVHSHASTVNSKTKPVELFEKSSDGRISTESNKVFGNLANRLRSKRISKMDKVIEIELSQSMREGALVGLLLLSS